MAIHANISIFICNSKIVFYLLYSFHVTIAHDSFISLIIQGCILKVIPLDTDGSGLLIAAGLMLSQWFAPLIAKETRKLRVHFRIPSVPGYLLMYILCLVLIGASWFPIWMVLR